MKKISVLVPCLNETDNVVPMAEALIEMFGKSLPEYDYEILFIDNYSTDGTRDKLRLLCEKYHKVKAIFNIKNFGPVKSPVYGLLQTTGDCAIPMACDFQDPPDCVPKLVRLWEEGNKIVIAKKTRSKENPIIYLCRTMFYKIFNAIGNIEHIEHFTGFGLYDRTFLDTIGKLDDPMPYFRGLVTELGPPRAELEFVQPKRKSGKTKTNFFSLYDTAMLGFTSYSKAIPRFATILGFIIGGISILIALTYLVLKLMFWDSFPMGMIPLVCGVFFFGSVQLFFIGFIGEYIMSINQRVMKRPLVIEEERLNFTENEDETSRTV